MYNSTTYQKPAFREWQLAHAKKYDYMRFKRLQIRWAYRTIVPPVETMSEMINRFAREARRVSEIMAELGPTLTRKE